MNRCEYFILLISNKKFFCKNVNIWKEGNYYNYVYKIIDLNFYKI